MNYYLDFNTAHYHSAFSETITCVCVLPLAASQNQRSSHSAPDWTCIALGFSSGALRFYTEVLTVNIIYM